MRIAHLVYDALPRERASGGGQLGMFQNLCAMSALGHEVHLLVCGRPQDVEPGVQDRVSSIRFLEPSGHALWQPAYWMSKAFHPETVGLRFPGVPGYSEQVTELCEQLGVDLVWADGVVGLAMAPFDLLPVVFGHYDFLFKLREVRSHTHNWLRLAADLGTGRLDIRAARRVLHRPDPMSQDQLRRAEVDLCRRAAAIMCVSDSEREWLGEQGVQATHIPIVGPTIPRPTTSIRERAAIVMFGNSNTAFRSQIAHLRDELWPIVSSQGLDATWEQVGKAPANPDDTWTWMASSFDQMHGYVDELGDALRPGDVSLVPYRHDTGFRTKLTVAAAHGVVSAGYPETFLCAPAFTANETCLVGDTSEELAGELRDFCSSPQKRRRLSSAARDLYEQAFTFEAQVPHYERMLTNAAGAVH